VDVLGGLSQGFAVALTPAHLGFALLGAAIGTAVGVLPGLGTPTTIAMLLPATYALDPAAAIILMGGIFCGAMYGGSTTSILLNVPGESASIVTCLDGHQLARQGRAGPALGISALASFVAASLSVLALSGIAPALSAFALRFGPAERASLVMLGLVLVVSLSAQSLVKGLLTAALGLVLGTVGLDPTSGMPRFTLGISRLLDGLDLVPVAMGLFGIAQVLADLEVRGTPGRPAISLGPLLPSRDDWRRSVGAILRGTGLGFLIGVLPGGGAVVASFAAYAVEKRVARDPERFGRGAIEGVAAPEAANNAAAIASFVPLLTLGIPGNASTAMIFVAFMVHGIQPGPLLVRQHPDLFWGVIASMYVANLALLALNLPLIGLWVRLLRVPYPYLGTIVVVTCLLGAYTLRGATFDVGVAIVFGVVGYILRVGGFPAAPLLLALLLGRLLERAFLQSLQLSAGDLGIFLQKPIAATLLALTATVVLLPAARRLAAAARAPHRA
jgi:putative tricarboxylic transport membrane protein